MTNKGLDEEDEENEEDEEDEENEEDDEDDNENFEMFCINTKLCDKNVDSPFPSWQLHF